MEGPFGCPKQCNIYFELILDKVSALIATSLLRKRSESVSTYFGESILVQWDFLRNSDRMVSLT